MNTQRTEISIGMGTVIKTVLILAAIYFAYLIRDIIVLLFISVIIVAAIDPLVDWMQKKRVPRPASVLIIYLILFALLSLSLSFIIPPMASQLSDFAKNYPEYYQKIQGLFVPMENFLNNQHLSVNTQNILDNVSNWLSGLSSNIFSTTIGVFSGLISAIAVLSMAFYMAVVEDSLKKVVALAVPVQHEKYAISLVIKMKQKIGKWMQGQIMLMAIIFILDYIGLSLVGIPYALPLAAFAGLLEIVPYVGPIISAVPGVVLGFLVSPIKGLLALIIYIITQQAESNIVTPLIMKRTVDLNPVVVILALLIGAKLGGILGAILAIPVATTIGIIAKDMMAKDIKKADAEAGV